MNEDPGRVTTGSYNRKPGARNRVGVGPRARPLGLCFAHPSLYTLSAHTVHLLGDLLAPGDSSDV